MVDNNDALENPILLLFLYIFTEYIKIVENSQRNETRWDYPSNTVITARIQRKPCVIHLTVKTTVHIIVK